MPERCGPCGRPYLLPPVHLEQIDDTRRNEAHQVRVNSVRPSPVNTRMVRSLESGSGASQEAIAHSIPLGRYAESADIANMVLFLLAVPRGRRHVELNVARIGSGDGRCLPTHMFLLCVLCVAVVQLLFSGSMKIPRMRDQIAQQRRHIPQMPGDKMRHVALPLERAIDGQEARAE